MDINRSAYNHGHHHSQQTNKKTSTAAAIVRSRPVQLAQSLFRSLRIGRKEKISKKAANKIAAAKSYHHHQQLNQQQQHHQHHQQQQHHQHHQQQQQQQIVVMPPPPTMQPASPPPSSAQSSQVRVNVIKRCADDYKFGKAIGEGSFSLVFLAKDIHTHREYAIKVCEKAHIIKEKQRVQVRREKDALNILSNSGSRFFVKLYCTFQDRRRLYFVMSFAKHGDLLPHINKVGSFDVACTRFYTGEILCALEHLHDLNIIHRDLKPENILLDEHMHIKVADFGCSKILEQPAADDQPAVTDGGNAPRQRSNSFVGTAQYVSPELLTAEKAVSPSSDLWAFGCIVYHMISGLPPFRSRSEYIIFKKIMNLDYEYPDGFNADAKDLVQKLLTLDPNERLGARDARRYTSIRSHPFYDGLDFDTLHATCPPPVYPYLPGNSESQELRSQYRFPDNLEPGLDDKQLTRLLGLDGQQQQSGPATKLPSPPPPPPPTTTPPPPGADGRGGGGSAAAGPPAHAPRPRERSGILRMNDKEKQHQLHHQRCTSNWHSLVEGNLIVKQGLVDKRKGLFARRRMLMLTMGPHLYYADPVTMTLKGEIPWSPQLRVEPKNFRIFFVHTPNRTYYLEDPEGFALEWCKAIEEMRVNTYSVSTTTTCA